LIFWSIPLALSGQHWDAPEGTLEFDPRPESPERLPLFTPQADGIIEHLAGDKWRLTVISGRLDLKRLRIGRAKTGPVSLRAGGTIRF
jgi:hypothetical protein